MYSHPVKQLKKREKEKNSTFFLDKCSDESRIIRNVP
jgi:hypothetical protein